MSPTETLLQSALELPTQKRAELALRLMESLDRDPEPDVEAAWAAEVGERVDALRRGTAVTRPAAEAFRDARAQLQSRRK